MINTKITYEAGTTKNKTTEKIGQSSATVNLPKRKSLTLDISNIAMVKSKHLFAKPYFRNCIKSQSLAWVPEFLNLEMVSTMRM